MNYEKLKEVLKNHKFTAAKASSAIDRSEVWFHKAIKNDTMTIADLEKLLKLCKTNLFEFFGGTPSYQAVNEPSARESELLAENHALLKKVDRLRDKIEELEGKKQPEGIKAKKY